MYEFSWGLLGDIAEGRPNLGKQTDVIVYRLMQFCFRDVIEKQYGKEATDKIFYDAGRLAGSQLYKNVIAPVTTFNEFLSKTQKLLKELSIGVLRVEYSDFEANKFILTVDEDLDCSGLPELDYEICVYDEGFISALYEEFLGKPFNAVEIDCWCTGDRTCRFEVTERK